jgi:ABC-type lipoprotein release transport system permease subunit
VVLAVLLGVLASVRPSRRASKMGVLEAIAHD